MSLSKRILISLGITTLFTMQAATAQATPNNENTVKVNAPFEFSSLNPTRRGYVFTRMQVIETLVNVDESGALIPSLATKWVLSDDGKVWDFRIRENVKFHDGSDLSAALIAKRLTHIQQQPGPLKDIPIESIAATDPNTLRITLSSPFYPLGASLAHYSTSILADAAFDGETVKALIGTGPFSALEVVVPHKLVVQRFDDYWGKKASIEYASYLTGHRAEAKTLQARSGQSDIAFGLDPAAVPSLKRLSHLSVIRSDLPRTLAIKLNAGHELLDTVQEREALSLAIDRTGIAKVILRYPDAASSQLLPPYMKDWYIENTHTGQDLEKALSLLTEQGWKKNDEGWLEKGGKRFELEMRTYADRPELTTVATALQDQWKNLGVKLTVNVANSSSIPAGHQDGSLETALIARNYGYIANPLSVLLKDFGNEKGGDWGSMNWSKPAIQAQLQQLIKETNPDTYHKTAQTVAQAIYDEKPMIAVAYYVQQTAVNKRIEGFRFDPYERSFFLNELTWSK